MLDRRWAWVAAFGVLAAACSGPRSRVKQGRVADTIDQTPDRRAFIEAIGIGASDPALPTDTQRKALARDAAIVKAQYELLSMLKGVALEGGITVQRAIEVDSTLEAKLRETIKGAEVLKSEFTSDSGCVVTIRLPKHRIEDMMAVRWR
ncbi:MAG: hypothetical protein HY554_11370 [Elusimicrobia bacterium]|nr:hypothetical protein [Elusimicrobiota bacterium]